MEVFSHKMKSPRGRKFTIGEFPAHLGLMAPLFGVPTRYGMIVAAVTDTGAETEATSVVAGVFAL